MAVTKNMVESLREVVQDLLVPELKSVKVSIDSLRTENAASQRNLEQIIRSGDEKNEQAILSLSQKLDFASDIRERLASREARLPRQ
jgi:hypothetical protein